MLSLHFEIMKHNIHVCVRFLNRKQHHWFIIYIWKTLFVFCRVNQKLKLRVVVVRNQDEKEFLKRLGTLLMTRIPKSTHAPTATKVSDTSLLLQDTVNFIMETIVFIASYVKRDLWISAVWMHIWALNMVHQRNSSVLCVVENLCTKLCLELIWPRNTTFFSTRVIDKRKESPNKAFG